MKKFLTLTLALAFTTFASLAFADDSDVTITISKASDSMAKVCSTSGSKCSGMVPITFADGASWDSLKDTYTVSPETASEISSKKLCLSVTGDGVVSFKSTPKSMCGKACSKK